MQHFKQAIAGMRRVLVVCRRVDGIVEGGVVIISREEPPIPLVSPENDLIWQSCLYSGCLERGNCAARHD